MKTRHFGIILLGSAAFLLAVPAPALAKDADEGTGNLFSGPLLSRFLPGSASDKETSTDQNLPSRFSLGFFTTSTPDDENDFLSTSYQPNSPPSQMTALANIGYGSYYGTSRLETNRPGLLTGIAGLDEPGSNQLAYEDNLSLSLEAGLRRQDLSTGILYAFQSGYPTIKGPADHGAPYPSYIFAPLNHGSEQSRNLNTPEGHAVFLYLGYNHSQQLNLRGTLGLARTGFSGDDDSPSLQEQSRRWGLDFAATYKLLDNLVYEAHLGYVSIDETSAAPEIPTLHTPTDGTAQSAGGEQGADSVYHVGSHIRMTF